MKAKSKWFFFQISECCCIDTPEEEVGDEERSTCCCLMGAMFLYPPGRVEVNTHGKIGLSGHVMGGILRKGTCFWEMDRDQGSKSRWWFWMCFFHPRGSPWLCLLCNPEVACSISPYIPSSWMLKTTIGLNLYTQQEQIHRLWEWSSDWWGLGGG